jgi:hypothetical protein
MVVTSMTDMSNEPSNAEIMAAINASHRESMLMLSLVQRDVAHVRTELAVTNSAVARPQYRASRARQRG